MEHLSGLSVSIIVGWKGLTGPNTVANCGLSLDTKKKYFFVNVSRCDITLKLGSNKRVSKTQIHPSKTMRHFVAKTIRADSTLERLHPVYFSIWFLDPDQPIFCTIQRCLLVVNKLHRNQISLRQHIFYYKCCPRTRCLVSINKLMRHLSQN
jgi:hypothetical protein